MMNGGFSHQLLSEWSRFVADRLGLHFPEERWRELANGIQAATREFGLPDTESGARCLLSTPMSQAQVEILARDLTIGETYFFREPRSFAAIEEFVLRPLIRARRESGRNLRIWSAGCCTGEEA